MRRTQIYLTEHEQEAVKSIAQRLGTTQSDVIRTAVDTFIAREDSAGRLELMRSARGIWSDRTDLPDADALRSEWDRPDPGADGS